MNNLIEIIKGIHPGKFIERELNQKKLTQRTFAEEIGVPYQTINAIIAGRRNLTIDQSLKIDRALGYEDGFFAILQTHYDIKSCKDKELACIYTEAPHVRKALFWDVDFNRINWAKYKKAVMQRILERGSKEEIEEIKRFYELSDDELRAYLDR